MYSGISVYKREVAQSILYKTIKSALLSRQSNQWEIDLSHSFTHQLEKIALNKDASYTEGEHAHGGISLLSASTA